MDKALICKKKVSSLLVQDSYVTVAEDVQSVSQRDKNGRILSESKSAILKRYYRNLSPLANEKKKVLRREMVRERRALELAILDAEYSAFSPGMFFL